MRLTNKKNLPLPIVEAIRNDGYNAGSSDITVTGLLEPVRIGALKARYGEELTEDVSDRLYSLDGQAVHVILERAAQRLNAAGDQRYVIERRYYIDRMMPDGTVWSISGQIDVFDRETGMLQDYKRVSVYKMKEGVTEEQVKQLNMQAYLLKHGYYLTDKGEKVYDNHTVTKLTIYAMFRDWRKGEYQRELAESKKRGFNTTRYPSSQSDVFEAPLVNEEDVERYMLDRATEHKIARTLPDDVLPVCTAEERWATEDKFAVMKDRKAKKASKLFDTEEDAKIHVREYGEEAFVEARPGQSRRCSDYCPVASKCSIAKKNGWVK